MSNTVYRTSDGQTFSSKSAAEMNDSGITSGNWISGAGGGCLGILLWISAAAVFIASNIKFAIIGIIGYGFVLLARKKQTLNQSLRKKIAMCGWLIVVSSIVLFFYDKRDKPMPLIIGMATVTTEGAGEFVLDGQNFVYTEDPEKKKGDIVTLAAGDKVRVLKRKKHKKFVDKYQIVTTDGKKGYVFTSLYKTNDEGTRERVELFEETLPYFQIEKPPNFFKRVISMDLTPPRPILLHSGKYYPQVNNKAEIDHFQLMRQGTYYNKKQWKLNKINMFFLEPGKLHLNNENVEEAEVFIRKNEPPIEIDGMFYNFSISAKGETTHVDFVIINFTTIVCPDSKIVYKLNVKPSQ